MKVDDKPSKYSVLTFIQGEEFYGKAVVIPSKWSDLLGEKAVNIDKEGQPIYRGALTTCVGAKEVVPVWTGYGWADCGVEWLKKQGCPKKLLRNKRLNDRYI